MQFHAVFTFSIASSIWDDIASKEGDYLIQISPPADSLSNIVRVMVEERGVTNAAILFDHTFGEPSYWQAFTIAIFEGNLLYLESTLFDREKSPLECEKGLENLPT